MAADQPITNVSRTWPGWRWGVTALCVLGFTLSGYLGWHYLMGSAMIGCGGGSPCDDVLNSRWSAIAGVIPVSGLAAGAYLAMLLCSFAIGPRNTAPVRRLAWDTLLVLAGSATGSAVWFTIVQKWMIGSFCPYCMATHGTGVLLTGLLIWRATREFRSEDAAATSSHSNAHGVRAVIGRVMAGLILASLLVAAQVGLGSRAMARGGEASGQPTAVDARAVPLVGSPDARYVVTLLFDYKCPHCQQLHLMLGAALRRYGGQLAFALCPAPLNRQCNPYVPRDVAEFTDSCELARVALAVWRVDRAAFTTMEDWLYSFDSGDRWRPRSLAAATAKAIELVGQRKFEAAMSDAWIDRYIQTSVRLYGETMQNGKGGVPKLIYGPRWVSPQPTSAADLVLILQNTLGLPKPEN